MFSLLIFFISCLDLKSNRLFHYLQWRGSSFSSQWGSQDDKLCALPASIAIRMIRSCASRFISSAGMTLIPWDLSTTSVLDCRPCLWSPLDGITTRVKEWGGSYFGDLLTMIILSVKFVEYGDCGLFEYYISKLANYRSFLLCKDDEVIVCVSRCFSKGCAILRDYVPVKDMAVFSRY
jgi:hypothetical protein